MLIYQCVLIILTATLIYVVIQILNSFIHELFQCMTKARQDHNSASAQPTTLPEYKVWEEHWIRYTLIDRL